MDAMEVLANSCQHEIIVTHKQVSKPGAGLQPKTAPPTCEGPQALGWKSLIPIPFLNCQPSGQSHGWGPAVPNTCQILK